MDPRLVRLFEQGDDNAEVPAILRLRDAAQAIPASVRPICRFGNIVTVRLRRGDIPSVHADVRVASMKAAGPLLQEARVAGSANDTPTMAGDIRRPRFDPASGTGTVVGLIDWGFDFAHPDFRHADGTTRLLALWDQTAPRSHATPRPYDYGTVHSADSINAALATADPYAALSYQPSDSDADGGGTHATHVAGIAIGNGRSGGPPGVAPNADIIFVQLTTLGQDDPDLADSATVLEAIDFIRRTAGDRPLVINLSMGQCGDPHDGTTLVEQGFDAMLAEAPGRAIVQSTGNYFGSRMHSSGRLRRGETRILPWHIASNDDESELEVWYAGSDAITVTVQTPAGGSAGKAAPGQRVTLRLNGRSCGTLHNRRRDPNNLDNHVLLSLKAGVALGTWQVVLQADTVPDGQFHAWIQRGDDDATDQATFPRRNANPFFTTNSICNGHLTIAVGAYDSGQDRRDVATFSSAGPTRDGRAKPDLLAPGVDILSARSTPAGEAPGAGLLVRMTGTSMAAPHVTGTIALIAEAVAPRRLSAREMRDLLLSCAQPSHRDGRDAIRYGRGYLDIDAAVATARGLANRPEPTVQMQRSMETAMEVADLRMADRRTDPVAFADYLIGLGGSAAASPAALMARVLTNFLDPELAGPLLANGLTEPAALFDCFINGNFAQLQDTLDPLFEIVAYPRQQLMRAPQPGDILLRRALGEPGLGHAAFLASADMHSPDDAARRGIATESMRPGLYVQVVEAGTRPHRIAHRFARRLASAHQQVEPDTLLLRPRLIRQASERSGGTTTPAAPPAAVAGWRLGVDFAGSNTVNDASFAALKAHDKLYAIIKCSQGVQPDTAFTGYYRKAREHGLIRGSYHFLANKRARVRPHYEWNRGSIADQAALVVAQVAVLLPGDLAPALDLEDEPRNAQTGRPDEHGRYPLDQGLWQDETGYHYRAAGHLYADHGAAGRRELLTDIQDFLDRLETALGRTPLIYTSHMWRDSDMMNNPADPDPDHSMARYPLWTVYHGERDLTAISVGNWGRNWMFIQYAEQGSQYWSQASYVEAGIDIPGLDFNAFRPSLSELRGLADIGRLSAAFVGQSTYLAFADAADHLHVLPTPDGTDQDLTATLGRTSGDPVLLAGATDLYLYFRAGDHLVEATAASATPTLWHATDIEDLAAGKPVQPLQDPRAILVNGQRHVVYVGDDNDWHVLISGDAGWQRPGGMLAAAGLRGAANSGLASGQPSLYVSGNATHVVGRVGADGHLLDVAYDGRGWSHDDVTALARDLAPDLPAATYSPCIYQTQSGFSLVFRGVGGDLWVIDRSTNAPTNLMVATRSAVDRAPTATGHPTCFVLQNRPHVVYRGGDSHLYDLWLDAGRWQRQVICGDDLHKAAADPVATSNATTALVVFRGSDEQIHTARFDGNNWTCSTVAH